MICPKCGSDKTRVTDTKTSNRGEIVRRRRACPDCGFRFNTTEIAEKTKYVVVKKNGRKVPYDQDKLRSSILIATQKRGLHPEKIEEIIRYVEMNSLNGKGIEIPSSTIAEHLMKRLMATDTISYLRFASVYKNFENLVDFQDEIKKLMKPNGF